MLEVVFELTTPVFEQAKTVHALDSAVTVIGTRWSIFIKCVPVNRYIRSSKLNFLVSRCNNL
jgi:hypothetical protein